MTEEEKKEVSEMISKSITAAVKPLEEVLKAAENGTASKEEVNEEVELLKKQLEDANAANRLLLESQGKTKTLEETLYEAMGGKLA